jgi:hypothetical protein
MVLWDHDTVGDGSIVDIYALEGDEIYTQVSNGMSNQSPQINNHGHFAWTRYNFSLSPWESTIMLQRNGEVMELTHNGLETPGAVRQNDRGDVVWVQWNGEAYEIRKWFNGLTTTMFVGYVPDINDHGDICFAPRDERTGDLKPYLYRNDVIYRLPDNGFCGGACSINERGEVAWRGINGPVTNAAVSMLRAIQYPGDYNEDCGVTLRDSQAFHDCVGGPTAHGVIHDERCRVFDFDGDNDIDFHDFGSFQQAFTGVPESIEDCAPRITDFECPDKGGDE